MALRCPGMERRYADMDLSRPRTYLLRVLRNDFTDVTGKSSIVLARAEKKGKQQTPRIAPEDRFVDPGSEHTFRSSRRSFSEKCMSRRARACYCSRSPVKLCPVSTVVLFMSPWHGGTHVQEYWNAPS